jgi:hypothetical protein
MNEQWRVIDGHPGYSVSNLGRVRRDAAGRGAVAGRILTAKVDKKGYGRVDLSLRDKKIRRLIHQLVAVAFLEPRPSPEHFPNHLDGVKLNNSAANLEWATRAENAAHASRLGLLARLKGERNGRARLTAEQVDEIRCLEGVVSQRQVAAKFGVSRTLVQRIHQGKAWVADDPRDLRAGASR